MSKNVQAFKLALKSSSKTLANFTSQLQQQQQLLTLIKSVLPGHLAEHAHYSVISKQRVLIYTDKAVWASQLRFYQGVILGAIKSRNQYANIEQVQMKLLQSKITPTARAPKIPSLQTTKHIRLSIHGGTKDPLSQALNHLCQTLEKLSRQSHDPE